MELQHQTYILCEDLDLAFIQKALHLGNLENDEEYLLEKYEIYEWQDKYLVLFSEGLDFGSFLYINSDFQEIAAGETCRIRGYITAQKGYKITDYLNEERVCLYLSSAVKEALKTHYKLAELDVIDIVTTTNSHYTIELDSLFSSVLYDEEKYDESHIHVEEWTKIEESEIKISDYDMEEEYIESWQAHKAALAAEKTYKKGKGLVNLRGWFKKQ